MTGIELKYKISVFRNSKTRIMIFGNRDFAYGETISKSDITEGNPTRIYTLKEIREIMLQRNMKIIDAFSGYSKNPSSANDFQMLVHSKKAGK